MASLIDVAWAAGIFEGEGCFRAQRLKNSPGYRGRLELSIAMTDRDVLERVREAVGCGSVRTRTIRAANPHWKPQYVWRVSGKKAADVAEMFRPYLLSRRTARLDEILRAIENSKPAAKECACCGKRFTPKRFARQRFCSIPCADSAKYLRRKYDTESEVVAAQRGFERLGAAGSRTHCPSGHELAGDNVHHYMRPNGATERRCRACGRERQREYMRLRVATAT